MIRSQLIAVGFRDQAAAGDTQQGVVSFIVIGGRKVRLVGCNQRKTLGISKIDQRTFDAPFLLEAVTLQLDIEPIAEKLCEFIATRGRKSGIIGIERQRHGPVGATCQCDQSFAVIPKPSDLMCGA